MRICVCFFLSLWLINSWKKNLLYDGLVPILVPKRVNHCEDYVNFQDI